jgi:hypothetical protein
MAQDGGEEGPEGAQTTPQGTSKVHGRHRRDGDGWIGGGVRGPPRS